MRGITLALVAGGVVVWRSFAPAGRMEVQLVFIGYTNAPLIMPAWPAPGQSTLYLSEALFVRHKHRFGSRKALVSLSTSKHDEHDSVCSTRRAWASGRAETRRERNGIGSLPDERPRVADRVDVPAA
jgi:hypothetical protein